jgi:hypothetical protein
MTTGNPRPEARPRRAGAPSSYRTEYAEEGRKLCLLLGATDEELSRFFGVPLPTLAEWLAEVPAFAAAVKAGRELADAEVADRLYRRAIGYSHDAVRVFSDHSVDYVETYPPDTTACIFWLKSRQPERWRERVEHDHDATAEMLAALDAAGERAKNVRRG